MVAVHVRSYDGLTKNGEAGVEIGVTEPHPRCVRFRHVWMPVPCCGSPVPHGWALGKWFRISRTQLQAEEGMHAGVTTEGSGALAVDPLIFNFLSWEPTMTEPVDRDAIRRRRRFPRDVIETCVRWYLTYRLSYRDVMSGNAPHPVFRLCMRRRAGCHTMERAEDCQAARAAASRIRKTSTRAAAKS
jgi:hypothetical protein